MAQIPPIGWFPRRGEVYWVSLEKKRPAIILSVDVLNRHALDVCVAGLTTVERKQFLLRVPVKAPEGGLKADSWVKCDQVTTLPKALVSYPPIGRVSAALMRLIEERVRIALGLETL